jgi:CysZ protein
VTLQAMLHAAGLAFRDIFSRPFRTVLLKSLALTLGILVALWGLLQWLAVELIESPWPWLDTAISILSGLGLVVGLAFLVAPVTAAFAGLFLDDVAEIVERTHYSADPVGRPLPFSRGISTALRFLSVVLLVNLIALPLVLVIGFGFLIFLFANAYLLGREYFELAAVRHHDEASARRLRARYSGRIFLAGLLIAAVLAVPVLNLFGPLFATAFMVHVQKAIAAEEKRSRGFRAR